MAVDWYTNLYAVYNGGHSSSLEYQSGPFSKSFKNKSQLIKARFVLYSVIFVKLVSKIKEADILMQLIGSLLV